MRTEMHQMMCLVCGHEWTNQILGEDWYIPRVRMNQIRSIRCPGCKAPFRKLAFRLRNPAGSQKEEEGK